MQFLVFCAAVLRAVDEWQGLLRASDRQRRQRSPARRERGAAGHPLGVPRRPADGHLRAAREGRGQVHQAGRHAWTSASACCRSCRATPATATAPARSRSPATSSSSAPSRRARTSRWPNMMLNAAMADSLDEIATELEKATAKGEDLKVAVGKLLTKIIKKHKRIVFNGNNYSAEWHKEAAQARAAEPEEHRGRAAAARHAEAAIKLLDRFKILNERELHARYEVFLENYNKTHQHRRPADGADGQPLHPAGGPRVPEADRAERGGGEGRRRQERPGQEAADHLHQAGGQAAERDRRAGEAARPQRRLGREARQVHARQGGAGDGQAARRRATASRC